MEVVSTRIHTLSRKLLNRGTRTRAKDVGQFSTVSIASASDLGARVVKVAAGQQLSEHHLGHPYALFGMLGDRNAGSIVPDRDRVGGCVVIDSQLGHLVGIALVVVGRVHQDLVKDLEEPRHVGHTSTLERDRVRVGLGVGGLIGLIGLQHPGISDGRLNRAHV